jgi:hypothetical protein
LFLHLTSHPADRALPWRLALFGLSLLLGIAVQRDRRRLRSIRWQLQLPEQLPERPPDRRPDSGWLLGQPDQTPCPGRPEVMIDLDHWMLLRWRPNHGGDDVWLTVSRRDLRPHWHPLRCALFRHPNS